MSARHAYGHAQSLSWTRIDMLLFIYDHAIERIEAGVAAVTSGVGSEIIRCRQRAQQAILLIVDGLNVDTDHVAQQTLALCTHVLGQLATETPEAWTAAGGILRTLREGYQEVAAAARTAEAEGRVPAVVWP